MALLFLMEYIFWSIFFNINPMGLIAALVDSYLKNGSEAPNYHQNLDIIPSNPVN